MKIKYEDVEGKYIARSIYLTDIYKIGEDEVANGIDIVLTVNGEEVNFLDYIAKFDDMLTKGIANFDEEVKEKAELLLKEKHEEAEDKLRKLLNKLDDVENFIDSEFY